MANVWRHVPGTPHAFIMVLGLLILISVGLAAGLPVDHPNWRFGYQTWDDVNLPPITDYKKFLEEKARAQSTFKYKWVAQGGGIHDEQGVDRLEIAATLTISETSHMVGANIVSLVVRNMPPATFIALARNGRVGLFTSAEGTTIFPEYAHLRDRPECQGTCAGACSDTCTSDGRKYDSLAGLGGQRATCLDDNFMCTANDPYRGSSSILVHEFAHTIHQYALPSTSPYWELIYQAWYNARQVGTWDVNSYAMSNHLEYFAEASGVFFNVNHHSSSSGGMNSCGRSSGFCQSETEARAWLALNDPDLYEGLMFTYTNFNDALPGNLRICMYP